jgi:hypothetical protein
VGEVDVNRSVALAGGVLVASMLGCGSGNGADDPMSAATPESSTTTTEPSPDMPHTMPTVSAAAAPTTPDSRPLGELSIAELDEASLAHTDPITFETANECSPELTEIRARLGDGLDESQLAYFLEVVSYWAVLDGSPQASDSSWGPFTVLDEVDIVELRARPEVSAPSPVTVAPGDVVDPDLVFAPSGDAVRLERFQATHGEFLVLGLVASEDAPLQFGVAITLAANADGGVNAMGDCAGYLTRQLDEVAALRRERGFDGSDLDAITSASPDDASAVR